MRKLLLITLIFLFSSCEEESSTSPTSQQMSIYAKLTNSECLEDEETDGDDCGTDLFSSNGYVRTNYYPAVTETSFILDGLEIYSDDYFGMTGRSWSYDEWDQYQEYETYYEWKENHNYELEILAENGLYQATGICQIPGQFVINENILPDEIGLDEISEGFSLNWSNSNNASHYFLHYFIYDFDDDFNDYSFIDSSFVLTPETNSFNFTPDILAPFLDADADDFLYMVIRLESVNGATIYPGSEGNISGDGYGYLVGTFDPGGITIASENYGYASRDDIIKHKMLDKIKNRYDLNFRKSLGLKF